MRNAVGRMGGLWAMLAWGLAAGALAGEAARVTTGTAFAVREDGCFLTCLHVVKGATRVRVTLGEKAYEAAVLGTDEKHDLAVIRIQAAGVPTLPLADSAAVELGQEIRAFGFPLGHTLGQDLKVTRGTVSGISERGGREIFQVDAAINAGNSGGPLVNEKGEVVGVVNAKIMDAKVSNVAFAVPINYAKELLRAQGVALAAGSGGPKLDGPALVRRVAPSVAFVTVWGAPVASLPPRTGYTLPPVPGPAAVPGTSPALARAQTLFQARRYREALPEFAAALQAAPENPAAETDRALCFFWLNELPAALAEFRRLSARYPTHPEVQALRIESELLAGDPVLAKSEAAARLTRFRDWYSLQLAGLAAVYTSDADGARRTFAEALRLEPKLSENCLSRGQAYLTSGNYQRAVLEFITVNWTAPNDHRPYWGYGMACARMGSRDSAIKALERYLQSDATSQAAAEARQELARLRGTP